MIDKAALVLGVLAAAVLLIVRALRWAIVKYQEVGGG